MRWDKGIFRALLAAFKFQRVSVCAQKVLNVRSAPFLRAFSPEASWVAETYPADESVGTCWALCSVQFSCVLCVNKMWDPQLFSPKCREIPRSLKLHPFCIRFSSEIIHGFEIDLNRFSFEKPRNCRLCPWPRRIRLGCCVPKTSKIRVSNYVSLILPREVTSTECILRVSWCVSSSRAAKHLLNACVK